MSGFTVPYGLANGTSGTTARWYEVCRASVTRMLPGTVRYCLLVMSGAPPRYADVPTPSRTEDKVMKEPIGFRRLALFLYCAVSTGESQLTHQCMEMCKSKA